jgi:L-seryl-tRNA(Ser) seleniumtransferase
MAEDRFGNPHAPGLPYAHGEYIRSSKDDHVKLRQAWRIIERRARERGLDDVYNFSGLERGFDASPDDAELFDDELAPALMSDRLNALALDHLGGDPATHEIMALNRQTAAVLTATLVLVRPGETVIGVSATGSHHCVIRAAKRAGANFIDTVGLAAFEKALRESDKVTLVSLTRLAVSYEILSVKEIERIVDLAHGVGAKVLVDDAGGARVGPAVFDQPKMLELGVDVGSTGLDKYGTVGPRIGLLGGRREIVEEIRALAFELGIEARPMIYPAIVRSLEQYDPARVRELVATTKEVIAALKKRLGNRITETPVIARLDGEDILEIAMERADLTERPMVPVEASAGLAMLLLRDYGVLTVHFAGLPPGTSSMLIKFLPPETLARFGGAERFADAIDRSLDRLADVIGDPAAFRNLLFGEATGHQLEFNGNRIGAAGKKMDSAVS